MDVFYKIKALHQLGVKITLHAFQYGDRKTQKELEKYVENIFYYKRNMKIFAHINWKPFIVSSRKNKNLFQRLSQDQHPILFEGLHTTAFINNSKFKNRLKIVRMHNVEWKYYANLASLEKKTWKKLFFRIESFRLKWWEKKTLKGTDFVLGISKGELEYLEQKHENCVYLPPFHANNAIKIKENEVGKYALFHGKLSVSDNENAALFLMNEVFSDLDFPLIIAGKEASQRLKENAEKHSNVTLISDVPHKEMKDLIEQAQIHILWSFQVAGMKLKLLEALFAGKHCVLNKETVAHTGLEELCHIVGNSRQAKNKILELKNIPFSKKEIELREKILLPNFSNSQYAEQIVSILKKNEK